MERAEHQCDVKSDGNGGTEVDILFEICETSGRYCSEISKRPFTSVCTSLTWWLTGFSMRTLAPGIAAFEGSVTVP
jgi:hypothetical protein